MHAAVKAKGGSPNTSEKCQPQMLPHDSHQWRVRVLWMARPRVSSSLSHQIERGAAVLINKRLMAVWKVQVSQQVHITWLAGHGQASSCSWCCCAHVSAQPWLRMRPQHHHLPQHRDLRPALSAMPRSLELRCRTTWSPTSSSRVRKAPAADCVIFTVRQPLSQLVCPSLYQNDTSGHIRCEQDSMMSPSVSPVSEA